jgi:hypothetical protein
MNAGNTLCTTMSIAPNAMQLFVPGDLPNGGDVFHCNKQAEHSGDSPTQASMA